MNRASLSFFQWVLVVVVAGLVAAAVAVAMLSLTARDMPGFPGPATDDTESTDAMPAPRDMRDPASNFAAPDDESMVDPVVAQMVDAWPAATYEYFSDGKNIGTISMKNEYTSVDGRVCIRMSDAVDVALGDRKMTLAMTADALAEPTLTPMRLTGDVNDGANRPEGFRVTFFDGTMRGEGRHGNFEKPFATPLVTEFTIFRVMAMMPFEEGAELLVYRMRDSGEFEHEQVKLICLGRDQIQIGGAWRDTYVFAWKTFSRALREDGTIEEFWFQSEHRFWYSLDRKLVRVSMDGTKEWRLASE